MPTWLQYLLPIGSAAGGLFSGLFNYFSQKHTNETNLKMARETNQANSEQANLAYTRSLPVNQVSNLMSAGMSKPAALASLSGGGTYTAPVMSSAHMDAPQLDLSAAFERLENIPSNVEQRKLVQAQRHDLEVATLIKENQDKRASELHEFELWQRQYGKETATMLDAADSTIMNSLLDSGKEISDYKSYEDLVRGLGLQDRKELRNLPSVARQQVFNNVKDKFAEYREQREQQNRNIAAQDAHDISNLEKLLKRSDLNERQQTLVYKLGILANQVEQGNLDIDKTNYEKILRDAGFESKKEAAEAIAASEMLEADTRRNRSRYINVRSDNAASHLGYAIEWFMDKISPFKGLLNTK